MKSNKNRLLLIIIAVLVVYLSFGVNSAFVIKESDEIVNAYRNHNLVRLHVIANSNSPQDQFIKRRVREKMIAYMAEYDKSVKENGLVGNNIEPINKKLNNILEEMDVKYSGKVEYGNFHFPKRSYGNITLPPGDYKALRIILGRGKGANWWCVLFPPLCLESKEKKNKSDNITLKLKIGELLNKEKITDFPARILKIINENQQVKSNEKIKIADRLIKPEVAK